MSINLTIHVVDYMMVSVFVRDMEEIKLLCSLLEVVVMYYEVSISTCYEISQIQQTLPSTRNYELAQKERKGDSRDHFSVNPSRQSALIHRVSKVFMAVTIVRIEFTIDGSSSPVQG